MQENNNDYLDNLKRYWRNFIKRGVESENIRPTVLASWKRSIEYGVDPYRKRVTNVLDQNKLEQLRSKNKKFIEISKPVLQNLCDFIANSGFVIALSDADGIIMEIMGDITFKNIVVNDGFVEGADWNEKTAGTNAIGTALFVVSKTTRLTRGSGNAMRLNINNPPVILLMRFASRIKVKED